MIDVRIKKYITCLAFFFILVFQTWFVSSASMHHELSQYQDTIEMDDNDMIQLNHYRRPSEWQVDQINKSNIDKKGIVEINRFQGEIANKIQVKNSWELYNKTYNSAKEKGWFNISKGLNDSYFNSSISSSHYPSRKYLYDGEVLNPKKPEYLMYYLDREAGKQKLLGVMFMTNRLNETGRQIGGSLSKWHYHRFSDVRCYEENVLNLGPKFALEDRGCNGTFSKISPEMLHVWFIERRNGPFSTGMGANAAYHQSIPEKMSKKEFTENLWKSYPDEILQCTP